MKFPRLLFVLLLFSLVSCGLLPETGNISFKVPEASKDGIATFHNPDTGTLSISVSLFSSFDTAKEARIYVDNVGPYSCWLQPGITTLCNNVDLIGTGAHTLRAEVDKVNGDTVSTEISVEWVPYSPVETFTLNLAGKLGIKSPQLGFNVIFAIFSAILVILFLSLRAGKVGAVVISGFFFLGIILFASPDISALVIQSIYGVAGGIIFIILIKIILDRMRHVVFIRDGQKIGAYIGEGGQNGAQVVRALGQSVGEMQGPAGQQLPVGSDPRQYLPGDRVTVISPHRPGQDIIDLE